MTQSDLMLAIDRYRAAEAISVKFDENEFCVANAAFKAAVEALPHHTTVATFVNVNETRRSLSTESVGTIATARRVLQDVKDGHIFTREITESDAEYLATIREVVIAADKREIEIESLRVEHRLDEIGEQADKLGNISALALDEALTTPVRDVGELLLKAELVHETDNWDRMGEDVLADIRRLAGEGE